MNIHHVVDLSADEKAYLQTINSKGTCAVRRFKRAQILLLCAQGQSEADISTYLSVSRSTISRTKQAFVHNGMDEALNEQSRTGRPRKLDGKQEALLIATACSKPPAGTCSWTLQLLAENLVASTQLDSLSVQTVMRCLKRNDLKPWQKKMWCIPKCDAHFVAQMEHILDLYAQPDDPEQPVINFDETHKQLVQETRPPLLCKPGHVEKYDYEYKRAGSANIFVFFDRYRGWRHAKATQQKTATDFAECMRELVDVFYPHARVIRVVLDNLSTHTKASLYKAFPADQAYRIAKRLEFHYTPTHASWLNMVEIEIGVMSRQCLDCRIPDICALREKLHDWQSRRNKHNATIKWMFDLEKARKKLKRAYQQCVKTFGIDN